MHFAPAAIKHGIIRRKNSLVRILNQRLREACACATTDLYNSAIPLLYCYRHLPVTDDAEVLTATNNKPGSALVRGNMRTRSKAARQAATCAGEMASIERCRD
jgi:hypothetical protein